MEGPQTLVSQDTHRKKYRQEGETFRESQSRIANTLANDPQHFYVLRNILLDQRFLAAGRVQSDIGSPRGTTAFNCFVSDTIEDSLPGIMRSATEGAYTMRLGGGIGYDFSTIRPRDDIIVSLDSRASGPVSFMHIHDAVCKTIKSAGERRGAQMGVLRVDHPCIEEFIEAKTNKYNLTQFNISVAVTDEFMEAVVNDRDFDLVFNDRPYKRVSARNLWDKIMRATWDWAEPGVLFIDRINSMNNLWYCEAIAATNPCGEQPLPPYGACLLGSFNLAKYIFESVGNQAARWHFNWNQFKEDIPHIVRAMDNVIDQTTYPLKEQEREAKSKRRMGLGVTGLANAGEALGYPYGSPEFIKFTNRILRLLANECYQASALLAKEEGTFPLYDANKFLQGKFIKKLSKDTRELIKKHGLRNSHLTSIAPTGTISLSADNVSSGIEPVFAPSYERTIQTDSGEVKVIVEDYGVRVFGTEPVTAERCSVQQHLDVLVAASQWVDSAVSKTLNVGEHVSWEEFKDIYMQAWMNGCKGCTTFRSAGKRYGILNTIDNEAEPEDDAENGGACYFDLETGKKSCE